MRRLPLIAASAASLLLGLTLANTARADLADLSLGAKVLAGGSLFTTPTNIPGKYQSFGLDSKYEGLGFAGNGGGFSYGGGLYFEARFIKVIGLELDLIYDHSVIQRNVTYNSAVDVREKVDITTLRIPVLAKASLPMPVGRLFVLAGPEFVRGQSADPSIEITSGEQYVQNPVQLKQSIHADKANWTNIVAGLGFTIDLPMSLELPVELRASKNISQSSDWEDRVTIDSPNPFNYTVDAQTSWDFRLCAGLGYQF